jgi:hypothetical protein
MSSITADLPQGSRREWARAAVLAGAIVFFPFARSYYLFYLILLVWALKDAGLRRLWREDEGIRFGFYAIGLPILLTSLAWLFMGGVQKVWLEKFTIVALAALLGLAAAGFARDPATSRRAYLVMSIAILTWLGEGMLQLLMGNDIDCRIVESTCNAGQRVSLYFAKKTKIGYYLGIFALVPACWFLVQRRLMAAIATLVVAGGVVMAAGSRSGMVPWAVGCMVLAFVASAQFGRLRWLLLLGIAAVVAVMVVLLFHTNAAFHTRAVSSLGLLTGSDYATLNSALSGRLDIWVPLWQVIQQQWLFGVGPEGIDAAVRPLLLPGNGFLNLKVFHAHQVLLDVQAATGIIGLSAFVAFYGWVALRFIRLSAQGISLQWAWLLVFLLLWFPVNSHHGFYSSELVLLTFFVLGLGLATPRDAAGGNS